MDDGGHHDEQEAGGRAESHQGVEHERQRHRAEAGPGKVEQREAERRVSGEPRGISQGGVRLGSERSDEAQEEHEASRAEGESGRDQHGQPTIL